MTKSNILMMAVVIIGLIPAIAFGVRQVDIGSKKAQAAISYAALDLWKIKEIYTDESVTMCASTSLPSIDLTKLTWAHKLRGAKFGRPFHWKGADRFGRRSICRTYYAPSRTGAERVTVSYDHHKIWAESRFIVAQAPPSP